MAHYCMKCGQTLKDDQFFKSRNLERFPDKGMLSQCKKCITMHIDNWSPDTFLYIIEDLDLPWLPDTWNKILEKEIAAGKTITGSSVLGKYVRQMRLGQFTKYRWADSDRLAEEAKQEKIAAMRASGLTEAEIEDELAEDRTPERPAEVQVGDPEAGQGDPGNSSPLVEPYEVRDEYYDLLTEEDKATLLLKWGKGYTCGEWVRLEQLYSDMVASYDIQGAGMKDTLVMICKASLKANQCIDAGMIDEFQKMSKVYNDLMKSAKLTAAQIKAEDSDEIDSIGELVALCEAEGFIPRYYVSTPQDHVDRTIQDMQTYTRSLVTEELNLGNLIEAAVRDIQSDKAKERNQQADDEDEDTRFERELFAEEEEEILNEEEEYAEFQAFKEGLRQQDTGGE